MITIEELETYSKEELLILLGMIKELQIKKNPVLKTFYSQVDVSSEEIVTLESLFDNYLDWCNSSGNIPIDRKIFYQASHKYIKDYNIQLTKRTKEPKIKKPKPGEKTSNKEDDIIKSEIN